MIDEIRGYAVTGDKPGDAIFGAHDESGGGIAVDQLVLRRGQSPPLFRRDREDRPTARAGGVERLDQHARSGALRSEEHTSELQSLMRISYAVFCLKKKKNQQSHTNN